MAWVKCQYCNAEPKKGRGAFLFTCGTSRANPSRRGNQCLEKEVETLKNWGGRVLEFLDVFEGANDGENEEALEAAALQEEGLELGLVRLPSTYEKKRTCANCAQWEKEFERGYCESEDSPLHELLTGPEDGCDYWLEPI